MIARKHICEWALVTPAASTIRGWEIVRTANSLSFRWQLEKLIKILKPLHIAQKEAAGRPTLHLSFGLKQ
jgi:hypothetical protein